MKRHLFIILCSVSVLTVAASPTAPISGQPQSSSGTILHDGGVQSLVSSVASSANYQNRVGYIGQLTDVRGMQTFPDPAFSIDEDSNLPLITAFVNDDGTTTEFYDPPPATQYEIISGPIQEIDDTPVAVLEPLLEDTPARYRATYRGFTAEAEFTVLNSNPDNFGSYASDGLYDDWQIQFFGLDNSLAGPKDDPDGDGQSNRFEELSGYSPVDGSEFLKIEIERPANADVVNFTLSRVIPTTRYEVVSTTDLGITDPWTLEEVIESDVVEHFFAFKLNTAEPQEFFRVDLKRR